MSGLNTDLVRKAAPLFATQLSGSISPSDTTIPLQSIAGLPLDTAVTITIDATDANGNQTPTFKETVTGVVNAGSSSLINCLRGLDTTTAQAHSTGATVVQWFTANDWNDFASSFLTEHVQLGHHKALSDVNGKAWLGQTATSNAVNYITLANAATGASPSLVATGTDSNISVTITPKGTGQVVVPNGTVSALALTNPHKFSVYRNAGWTSPNNAAGLVTFDTVVYDTSSDYSTSTGKFTAPVAGFYHFNAGVSFNLNNSALGGVAIFKNGNEVKAGNSFTNQYSTVIGDGFQVGGDLQLAQSDYIQIYVTDASGGAGGTGQAATYFDGHLISVT